MLESFGMYLRSLGKSEGTVCTYMRLIKRLSTKGIDTNEPEAFVSSLQKWLLSNSDSKVLKSACQSYYRFLTKSDNKIGFSPKLNNAVEVSSVPWLTPMRFQEFLKFMKANHGHAALYRRNVTIMYVFVHTGFKVSQVIDLTIGDVKFRKNYISSGQLEIPLSKTLYDALKLWIDYRSDLRRKSDEQRRSTPLFLTMSGKKMNRRTISQVFESYSLPNMKVTPEILRHTFAKWMMEATRNDTHLVSQLLGVNQSRYLLLEKRTEIKDLHELPI